MSKHRKSKYEFYHLGTDSGQKTPDITMDLRRITETEIESWTKEEKDALLDFMSMCTKVFDVFRAEIIHSTHTTN